ncbi:putative uracil permease [Eremomyces bilateralis CBS 781.70]|uniref:Uracil permease n=1 Tax=Eremomyces bilateralis CBS 781.70 TaxID=1392243 RepID=A0A6G1G658_9PEZI|nr:putative uracil permease [Eremomyces bilateralis CBS 781.70]KAF1813557.1 putative uracil permease [Eremomyces bilateralis CBS 781.70]
MGKMIGVDRVKEEVRRKRTAEGWILPKQESSWAPPGTWSNLDMDITPVERRTWTNWTMFGYWFSDIISIQSWQTGSTILPLGLTWREAVFAVIFGSFCMAVPMSLNGYAGARTHAPFPILARSSFGYHLAKFPVIVRLITALFWHSITNMLAVGPMIQVIRSIWPSFRTLPNIIPESVGITSQQMVAYFLVWAVQFPIVLIPPHKMRWLFTVKVAMSLATIVGMTIWICTQAGGSGDIWKQQATVSGSTKSWLTMWSLTSCAASWSTVGVNIPDFTRYLHNPRSAFSQAAYFPIICSWVAIIGVVVASASFMIYNEYIWDPIAIIDLWEGPAGRAGAFFAGLSWLIAQICVNMSATVISGANDLSNLFPKWINIRRGSIIITIIGGWAMVPWKILHSASSLLSFMNSLGIFLAPTMGIQIADFYVVKRQHLDIPALYQPQGRYRYDYGINWRALVALMCSIVPALPGLAKNVNPDVKIGGAEYLNNFSWYYGIVVAFVVYSGLSLIWPAREALVPRMIESIDDFVEGQQDLGKGSVVIVTDGKRA